MLRATLCLVWNWEHTTFLHICSSCGKYELEFNRICPSYTIIGLFIGKKLLYICVHLCCDIPVGFGRYRESTCMDARISTSCWYHHINFFFEFIKWFISQIDSRLVTHHVSSVIGLPRQGLQNKISCWHILTIFSSLLAARLCHHSCHIIHIHLPQRLYIVSRQ